MTDVSVAHLHRTDPWIHSYMVSPTGHELMTDCTTRIITSAQSSLIINSYPTHLSFVSLTSQASQLQLSKCQASTSNPHRLQSTPTTELLSSATLFPSQRTPRIMISATQTESLQPSALIAVLQRLDPTPTKTPRFGANPPPSPVNG